MIIVKLIGGLGNQLFQYAFGKQLASINDTGLYLDISGFNDYKLHEYSLSHFQINANFADPLFTKRITGKYSIHRYLPGNNIVREDPKVSKSSYLKKYQSKVNYFEGYWQSEGFFKRVSSDLREELKLRSPLSEDDLKMISLMQNSDSISLHIRRGDYLSDKTTNSVHGLCDMEYYQKAIAYVKQRVDAPKFFIFSDDIEWCKGVFTEMEYCVFCDKNSADKNYADLYLMSQCRHNIIANSSFSWWGAWLNANQHKLVVAPKIWFANPEANESTFDLIPRTWTRI